MKAVKNDQKTNATDTSFFESLTYSTPDEAVKAKHDIVVFAEQSRENLDKLIEEYLKSQAIIEKQKAMLDFAANMNQDLHREVAMAQTKVYPFIPEDLGFVDKGTGGYTYKNKKGRISRLDKNQIEKGIWLLNGERELIIESDRDGYITLLNLGVFTRAEQAELSTKMLKAAGQKTSEEILYPKETKKAKKVSAKKNGKKKA